MPVFAKKVGFLGTRRSRAAPRASCRRSAGAQPDQPRDIVGDVGEADLHLGPGDGADEEAGTRRPPDHQQLI